MTREHWELPGIGSYFDVTDDYTADLEFYERMTAQNHRFLDLGSGTGRVALHLAKLGAEVVGVELSSEMLSVAIEKTESAKLDERIDYIQGNMIDVDLDRSDFDVAFIAEYSFAYLYSMQEQLDCLRNAKRHLRPGGTMVVHMFLPNHGYFSALGVGPVGGSVYEHTGVAAAGDGSHVIFSSTSRYSRCVQEINSLSIFETLDPDGRSRKQVAPLRTHVVYPREMELLLHATAFEGVELFGDFSGGDLQDDSWEMVAIARKPSS